MRSVFIEKYVGIAGAVGLSLALVAGTGCDPDPVSGSGPGAHLFNYCAPCHGTDGHGNKKYGAPAIAGLSTWYLEAQLTKFKNGQRGAHAADVEGLRMRPMMRVLRGKKDISNVAKYVSAMRPAHPVATLNGNAQRGKQLYALTCTACHGADARGNKELHAPSLIRSQDWYLLKQLHKFKNKVRGVREPLVMADGNQSPGQTMLLNAATVNKRDMLDIVAFIAELTR